MSRAESAEDRDGRIFFFVDKHKGGQTKNPDTKPVAGRFRRKYLYLITLIFASLFFFVLNTPASDILRNRLPH